MAINENLAKRLEFYKLTRLTPQFWRSLGPLIKKWIWADMRNGILQEGKDTYKSIQYKKYKSNYMNRLGTGQWSGLRQTKKGKLTAKIRGKKLKAYEGKSVKSNVTTSVNMLLTGETIDGLRAISADVSSVVMSYMNKDKDKIKGNEDRGRIITTLREGNIKKVKREIEIEMNKNIKNWATKKIVIDVGK